MNLFQNKFKLLLQNSDNVQNIINNPSTIISESKMKEYEHFYLGDVIDEKEQYSHLLHKSEAELGNLLSDLESYTSKSKLREIELRTHIQTLSQKLRIRDVNILKGTMTDLHSQIMNNITLIETKSREEIINNKNDIQTRIQLRLHDTDNRHSDILSDKVKDQEDFMRSLNDNIKEMERIRDSYTKIKKKVENLSKENILYKMHINEFEMKNSKLKFEMTNLKRQLNNLQIQIENKKFDDDFKEKQKLNTAENFYKKEYKKTGGRSLTSHSKLNIIKSIRETKESNDKLHTEEINESGNGKFYNNTKDENVTVTSLTSSIKNQNRIKIDIEKISELLRNEQFIKSNPRQCSIISSLANILENSKIKINKLNKEIDNIKPNTDIIQRVYEIIQNLKINTLTGSMTSTQNRTKVHNLNEIILNRDQRQIFIDNLSSNVYILNTVNSAKFPNIAVIERKLNY